MFDIFDNTQPSTKTEEQPISIDYTFHSSKSMNRLYFRLCNIIKICNHAYYNHAKPFVSDDEFDRYYKIVEYIEQLFPDYVTDNSPTQKVNHGFETEEQYNRAILYSRL